MSDHSSHPAQPRDGARVQPALVIVALVLLAGFQTMQSIRERSSLDELSAAQEPTVQEGLKLRRQLDTLAGKTAQLAALGNASAAAIIADLRRQGITVRAPSAGVPPR